jgi:hypothetical protein
MLIVHVPSSQYAGPNVTNNDEASCTDVGSVRLADLTAIVHAVTSRAVLETIGKVGSCHWQKSLRLLVIVGFDFYTDFVLLLARSVFVRLLGPAGPPVTLKKMKLLANSSWLSGRSEVRIGKTSDDLPTNKSIVELFLQIHHIILDAFFYVQPRT